MGIREGLLVLLADQPKYGYQLKTDFERATGAAWPLNVGQVYSTLQRLERDGYIAEASTDDEGRVSYELTEPGRRELTEWLTSPETRPVPARDEVAMKVLLATASNRLDPVTVVNQQRAATTASLQDYTRLRSRTDESELAWLLQLDRLILMHQAELRWLDSVEERLANRVIDLDENGEPTDPQPQPAVARPRSTKRAKR